MEASVLVIKKWTNLFTLKQWKGWQLIGLHGCSKQKKGAIEFQHFDQWKNGVNFRDCVNDAIQCPNCRLLIFHR